MLRRFVIAGLAVCLLPQVAAAAADRGIAAYLDGDHVTAYAMLLPKARKGEPDAAYLVGLMYLGGCGTPRDDKRGIAHLRRAAEAGHDPAAGTLAAYKAVDGEVPRDCMASQGWYRRTAAAGHAAAQFALSQFYLRPGATARDPDEAARWLQRAARQGQPDAQLNLGALYANGVGVPRDDVRAYTWLTLAHEQLADAVLRRAAARNRAIVQARLTPDQRRAAAARLRAWRSKAD